MVNDGKRWIRRAACGTALLSVALAWPLVRAEDPAAPAEKPAAAAPEIKVPDGSPEELLKFMDELMSREVPKNLQGDHFLTHVQSIGKGISDAADKIMAGKPTNAQAATAVKRKLTIYAVLGRLGDATAGKKLDEQIATYSKDPRADVVREAKTFALVRKFNQSPISEEQQKALEALAKTDPAKAQQEGMAAAQKHARDLWTALKALVADGAKPDGQFVELTNVVANLLEQTQQKELALEAYREMGKFLGASSDPAVAAYAERFAGSARFLDLPGHDMDIKGKLVNGTAFDWAAYKGKVVLVDYWATWCGPCIQEMPNVKQNYEAYHDKGFEVIGISLDDDRETLETFLKEKAIPWPILFSDTAGQAGWQHPMATAYGIAGIPCAILIGRNGKVITTSARGEELGAELAKLFPAGGASKPAN